jgi:hypothetical protein
MIGIDYAERSMAGTLLEMLRDPPREYSLLPFWFWNDALDEREILRQIADFDEHGVYGFVIHPRVGLPRSIGWMSDAMLGFMRVAIGEARRRDMKVILYDEGMYPSGSSAGQVVEKEPSLACRCLVLVTAGESLGEDAKVVREFESAGIDYRIVDRVAGTFIRGLHYLDETQPFEPGIDPPEDEPPAGDILNPRTAATVIELVHEKFAHHFRGDFGETIIGVFTDEPNALGRVRRPGLQPFTTGLLSELQRLTGHDFLPDLPALFIDELPGSAAIRERYAQAVRARLEETWYAPLHDWCGANGLWLMGHPDAGDEIGVQRHFHCPGQDLVWRWVEPGNKNAVEGRESTQGKCSSSAKLHASSARNSNEMAGAYGHQTTFAEVGWLAGWSLVRGVDLLIPHAFYYSIRGPREHERPPQLGPFTPEWEDGNFKSFAAVCRRLSWLVATSQHVCDVAILTHDDRCPWPAAKACFERQIDFNYLEPRLLLDGAAKVEPEAISIEAQRYGLVLLDGEIPLTGALRDRLSPLIANGRMLRLGRKCDAIEATLSGDGIAARARKLGQRGVRCATREPGLRVRQMRCGCDELFLFFNERQMPIETSATLPVSGERRWIDLRTGAAGDVVERLTLRLEPWQSKLLWVSSED